MFPFGKKRQAHKIDEATKKEILKLLADVEQSEKAKHPRLALILKMGSGYAAMALFTIAVLTFSALTLYGIYNSVRYMVYVDLPAMNSLNKLRGSLLAQENFAGKYAILKDSAFIGLFRQREKETIANLSVLENTGLVQDADLLKRQYREYQGASGRLFSGQSADTKELRPLALNLLASIDAASARRQEMLQVLLSRADNLRQATIKWTIILSCFGFLLAIAVAILITYRIFRSLKRLQAATHHLAAGDFHYEPITPVGKELSELAGDFVKIAARLKALEEMKETMLPEGDKDKTVPVTPLSQENELSASAADSDAAKE